LHWKRKDIFKKEDNVMEKFCKDIFKKEDNMVKDHNENFLKVGDFVKVLDGSYSLRITSDNILEHSSGIEMQVDSPMEVIGISENLPTDTDFLFKGEKNNVILKGISGDIYFSLSRRVYIAEICPHCHKPI